MPSGTERRDYYEVLGVARDATLDQIKSAYRQAALRHHPDRNPGDKQAESLFKEAAEAYAVLSDASRRARYDRFGHQGVSPGAGGFDPGTFADFEDIFGGIFGDLFGFDARRGRAHRGGRSGGRRGPDLRYDLEIDFEEAFGGTQTNIRVPRTESCDACGGLGAASASDILTCPTCGGTGQQRYSQGFFTIARTCSHCHGQGQVIRKPCGTCHGTGTVQRERTLKVRIPAGVETSSRLRIPGEGDAGTGGGPAGDLYVYIIVKEHPVFRREGANLVCTLPITFSQAALGGQLRLKTLDGVEKLKIPAGAQSGTEIRLKGRGAPDLTGGGRGDLIIQIAVRTPTRLTRESRRIFERLGEAGEESLLPEDRDILERLE